MPSTAALLETTDISDLVDVRIEQREFTDTEAGRVIRYNTLVLDFGDDLLVEFKTDKTQRQGIFFGIKSSSK